jgi:hypothetical protein
VNVLNSIKFTMCLNPKGIWLFFCRSQECGIDKSVV